MSLCGFISIFVDNKENKFNISLYEKVYEEDEYSSNFHTNSIFVPIDSLQTFIFNVTGIFCVFKIKVLSVAGPTVAQLEAFFSSDYL